MTAVPSRVLFVCTGNLCRSPLAAGLLRARAAARDAGHLVVADSAGTHARSGRPPEPLAVEVAADYGADITACRSRPLCREDFERFDRLVALDLGHLDFMRGVCPPQAAGDIRLLLAGMAQGGDAEVPDPYLGTRSDFEYAARLIVAGVERMLDEILSAREK